jgi:hypothetical protein
MDNRKHIGMDVDQASISIALKLSGRADAAPREQGLGSLMVEGEGANHDAERRSAASYG